MTPELREEAARCAEETARMERGERGVLRSQLNSLVPEFSDDAFGLAAEVAGVVLEAFLAAGLRGRFHPHQGWDLAATLLRAGWKRGDRIESYLVEAQA